MEIQQISELMGYDSLQNQIDRIQKYLEMTRDFIQKSQDVLDSMKSSCITMDGSYYEEELQKLHRLLEELNIRLENLQEKRFALENVSFKRYTRFYWEEEGSSFVREEGYIPFIRTQKMEDIGAYTYRKHLSDSEEFYEEYTIPVYDVRDYWNVNEEGILYPTQKEYITKENQEEGFLDISEHDFLPLAEIKRCIREKGYQVRESVRYQDMGVMIRYYNRFTNKKKKTSSKKKQLQKTLHK